MNLYKLAHCCFLLKTNKVKVLIDPAISSVDEDVNKYDNYDFDYILVSHAHNDHFADVLNLAQKRNVCVICVMSLKNYINKNYPNIKTQGFQPGGTLNLEDLKIKVFESAHENFLTDFTSVGPACYFAFQTKDKNLAYLADSAFNPSYYYVEKLMNKKMDYIIINVGTISTQSPEDALIVSNEIFNSAITIPAHYEMWNKEIDIKKMQKSYIENNLNIILAEKFTKIF